MYTHTWAQTHIAANLWWWGSIVLMKCGGGCRKNWVFFCSKETNEISWCDGFFSALNSWKCMNRVISGACQDARGSNPLYEHIKWALAFKICIKHMHHTLQETQFSEFSDQDLHKVAIVAGHNHWAKTKVVFIFHTVKRAVCAPYRMQTKMGDGKLQQACFTSV